MRQNALIVFLLLLFLFALASISRAGPCPSCPPAAAGGYKCGCGCDETGNCVCKSCDQRLHWAEHGDGNQLDLMAGDRQIGAYCRATGRYLKRTAAGWECATSEPTIALPALALKPR
jgi:hypothetical protein